MMIAPHFEEYAYLLARGIAEADDVLLVLDTTILEREYKGRHRPAAPHVAIRSNRFRSPLDLLWLIVAILRFRPQVIHWQEPSGLVKAMMAVIVVTFCRSFATVALTIHDPVPHHGRDARTARRLALFRRYARYRVHRLFVHGVSCRAQYLSAYLPAPHVDTRVVLTDHGVILAADADRRPEALVSALMFGRMERYKGLGVLCDAVELLAGQGQTIPLALAGHGPELDALETRFACHSSVRIDRRFVAAADLIAMIQAAHCVLLPYTGATQSGVLAAAFANGRFVIASRVGGIADVVEHGVNGLLVPPGDARALADALLAVAADEALRERLCEGARRTAVDRLCWSKIAAEMAACY